MQLPKSARCLLAAAGIAAASMTGSAAAQTAFTYQGVLAESGSPVNGIENIRFRIYDAQTGGTLFGETTQNIGVTDGVFSTSLNFGTLSTIDPSSAWLEIAVDLGGGTFETLGRQQVTAAPFAVNTRGFGVDSNNNITTGAFGIDFPHYFDVTGRDAFIRVMGESVGGGGVSSLELREVPIGGGAPISSWRFRQQAMAGPYGGALTLDVVDGVSPVEKFVMSYGIDGNVGIGTTNPTSLLTLESPEAVVGSLEFLTASGGDVRYDGGNDADFFFEHSGDINGSTIFGRTGGQRLFKIQNDGNIGIGTDTPNKPLTIESDGAGNTIQLNSNAGGSDWHLDFTGSALGIVESGVAERISIRDGGEVVVPGRTRLGRLYGGVSATAQIFGQPTDTFAMVVGDPNGIYRLSVNNNGDVATQCGVICASDERLKDDITSLESPLEKIMALRGVTFTWKDETLAKRGTQIGFVAQEVQEVLPELIGETPDGMLGVDYASMTSVLAGGMQEQQIQIETMKDQIAALESQMESLQSGRSMTGASMVWPVIIAGGLFGGIAVARRRMTKA